MSQKFTLQCHIVPELMQTRTHTTQHKYKALSLFPKLPQLFPCQLYIYIWKKLIIQHIPVFVHRTVCGQFLESLNYKEAEAWTKKCAQGLLGYWVQSLSSFPPKWKGSKVFEVQLEGMETSEATPNLDTDTAVRLLEPTSFPWKLHFLVAVHCWTHEASMPFCLATKNQQDPADYYLSCINKCLGWKGVENNGTTSNPYLWLHCNTHQQCFPHSAMLWGRNQSALHPGKTRGPWLTHQSTENS